MRIPSIARALGLVLGLTGALSIARPALGQQPTQPQPSHQQGEMQAMGPMMTQMTKSMLEATIEFYAQPTTARALATFTKNYLNSLVAAGFTRDEALRIVMAHGMPTLPGAR